MAPAVPLLGLGAEAGAAAHGRRVQTVFGDVVLLPFVQFVPVILEFLKSKVSPDVVSRLEKTLRA